MTMASTKGKTITIYKSDQCGTCAKAVPVIKDLAKKKGFRVKVIDVDKDCGPNRKDCKDVKYIPTIKVAGKEISPKELAEMLR